MGRDELLDPLLDDERPLQQLPPPPRRARTLTLGLMALTTVAAGVLAWQLRHEALYALNDATAVELGALADTALDGQHANAYVRASVSLQPKPEVRFRRLLESDDFRVVVAAERAGARRWVAYRVPKQLAGPRFLPPKLVAGRLMRVSQLGARYGRLAGALKRASGADEANSWVLVDGEDPSAAGWLLGLVILLLGLVGWNVVSVVRIVRKPGGAAGSNAGAAAAAAGG